MAKDNHTRYALLGLLNHESMSGYDIKKHIEYTISNFWKMSFGQIYPELKKLEEKGFVICKIETPLTGPLRKIYSITEKGRNELAQWLKRDVGGEHYRFELLLKLYFSSGIDRSFSLDKISSFRERREKKLDRYGVQKESLEEEMLKEPDHIYQYLTLLFGIHLEKAFISWADEATKILE